MLAVAAAVVGGTQLVHVGHTLLYEALVLSPPLHLLLPEGLLDPGTDGHRTLVLSTGPGVRVAEKQKLFADTAVARHAQLAVPRVPEHPLHPDAAGLLAGRVPALAGMYEELDALLDLCLALLLGISDPLVLAGGVVIQPQPQLLHRVNMPHLLVAHHTQVKVLDGGKREDLQQDLIRYICKSSKTEEEYERVKKF